MHYAKYVWPELMQAVADGDLVPTFSRGEGGVARRVVMISAFRDAAWLIGQYMARVDALANSLARNGWALHCVWVVGDCLDETEDVLRFEAMARGGAEVVRFDHGGPHFESVEDAQRFRQLADVWNAGLDAAEASGPLGAMDLLMLVECDLQWTVETVERMTLRANGVVAPVVLMADGRFYDTWAFRHLDGRRFAVDEHATFSRRHIVAEVRGDGAGDRLIEIGSAGSFLVADGRFASCRFTSDEAIVGFCQQVREAGGRIYVDVASVVRHP